MKSTFEKINYPYHGDKTGIDLRSHALKAYDYIAYLAQKVGAENENFIRNALQIVRAFGHDYSLVQSQVKMVEQRLSKRIDQTLRGGLNNNLPGKEIFRGGTINFGRIIGTNMDALLKPENFSGNMNTLGNYGMGKSNLLQNVTFQLVAQGIHVDIFDITTDFRDLLQISGCENGLVLNPDTEKLNPLEPIGDPEDHLQWFWEITQQDFNLRPETKELLYNHTYDLYKEFNVFSGKNPPTFFDLKKSLEEARLKKETTKADKNKIDTALRKLNYILRSFKNMVNCSRGYSLDDLDKFPFISYEIGNLSEEKRSWYMKLKLKQYEHKGTKQQQRHKVQRVLVIDEAKGIFGKSRIGEATNFIKDMYTKSRSIGIWWIISDQFASELANFTRLASIQISFQHTLPKEIREITAGMGCEESFKLKIPRLGRYKALLKISEYPSPLTIATYKSPIKRHITDTELKRLMHGKLNSVNYVSISSESKKIRLLPRIRIIHKNRIPEKTITVTQKPEKNPLKDFKIFLNYINKNPGTKLTGIYKALNFSCRKGNNLKNKLKDNGLIEENIIQTGRKGRPLTELKLTEKGRKYINEKRPS